MNQESTHLEFDTLLQRLQSIAQDAKKLPWSSKVLVDGSELLTLIHQLQRVLPEEVRQAQWILDERERILNDARQQANEMMQNTEHQAAALADQSEIVQLARKKSDEAIEQARAMAKEIHVGAKDYADEVLSRLLGTLQNMTRTLEKDRAELRGETQKNEEETVQDRLEKV
ncbi:MAG: ATPase [Firmicutes bacterium]|nr:ATPase [Bacillota bacterium]